MQFSVLRKIDIELPLSVSIWGLRHDWRNFKNPYFFCYSFWIFLEAYDELGIESLGCEKYLKLSVR